MFNRPLLNTETVINKKVIARSISFQLSRVGSVSAFKYIHSTLPNRDTIIQKDEITNLKIDMNLKNFPANIC